MPGPARHFRANSLNTGAKEGNPLWQERLGEVARANNKFFREARMADRRPSPASWDEDPGDADVRHANKGERRQAGHIKTDKMRYVGDEGRKVTAKAGAVHVAPSGKVLKDDLVLRAKGVSASDRAKSIKSNEQFFHDAHEQEMIEAQRTGDQKRRAVAEQNLKKLYDSRKSTAAK